jgi:hypothetical protein
VELYQSLKTILEKQINESSVRITLIFGKYENNT